VETSLPLSYQPLRKDEADVARSSKALLETRRQGGGDSVSTQNLDNHSYFPGSQYHTTDTDYYAEVSPSSLGPRVPLEGGRLEDKPHEQGDAGYTPLDVLHLRPRGVLLPSGCSVPAQAIFSLSIV